MATLLLELFSEEIPARMQKAAMEHLESALTGQLTAAGLAVTSARGFVTPRRVAVLLDGIADMQPDVTVEKKGPKTNAPQAALDGFLKSSGLTLDQLEKRIIGKDEVYFATLHQKGQPTASLLKPMIEKILAEFPWPKSMRWGSGEARWVRPLHSILCLLGGKVVEVEFAGVKAGNVTYGHRFMAPEAISLTNESEYEEKLMAAKVMADRGTRKAEIEKQATHSAAANGLMLRADPGLLEEVTGLVEWPTVLIGRIDAQFMDLPPEVLTSEMRAHQKYFALSNKDGSFSDQFLITSNMLTQDSGKAVVAGNERVLRARLADGRFFWDQDRKKNLSDWAEGLKGVTFHAKIGTMADKVSRIEELAMHLAALIIWPAAAPDQTLVRKAASLCKADLVTGMVGEFPELQGVMGRYYAQKQGEAKDVADAIRDHYLPLGPDSPVPTVPVSICVALADKLDTLMKMFEAGEKPTGSKDPFALRRSALGIIRIILENKLRLRLKAIPLFSEELFAFFADRLKVMLKDQGLRHDVISAVMAGGDDDVLRAATLAKAVQDFLGTENGTNLLAGYKRACNILAAEEKKDKTTYDASGFSPALFEVQEEHALATVLGDAEHHVHSFMPLEQYDVVMEHLAKLRAPLDAFFDKVLVNSEKAELRLQRLKLLARVRAVMNSVADFSKIEG